MEHCGDCRFWGERRVEEPLIKYIFPILLAGSLSRKGTCCVEPRLAERRPDDPACARFEGAVPEAETD